MTEKFHVAGIGNAIVDVLTETDDAFLARHGIDKGAMTLIDEARAKALYDAMGPAVQASGGSACNTIAGLAALGAKTALVGRVKHDTLGKAFAHDLKALGVHFETPMAAHGPETARCFVFVTPDAQRSMCTYLGACVELGPEDLPEAVIKAADVTYLEGYLWDPPKAKEAMRQAIAMAHGAGNRVALSLSDAFCVHRHRAEFLGLVKEEVDILFANESEIMALYETENFDEAFQYARGHSKLVALTRSEKGCVVGRGGEVHLVDAVKPRELVDTTGAGDQFAAGFLYGLVNGANLYDCGRMGAIAASEVIDHLGPRPQRAVRDLMAAGL